jgi:hypothetical protein
VLPFFLLSGCARNFVDATGTGASSADANELSLLNHNSPALTTRLREHKAYACGLAAK